MTATNHALTGATIGLAISHPFIALPLALLSHFACDVLPHFGVASYEERQQKKGLFHRILLVDALALTAFMISLYLSGASILVFACLFLAGAPDFVWAYRYIFKENFGKKPLPPMNIISRFHNRIQWSQTLRLGFAIELLYGLVFLGIVYKLL